MIIAGLTSVYLIVQDLVLNRDISELNFSFKVIKKFMIKFGVN